MTIAACYLSADGVVFGADSTTTMLVVGNDPEASPSEHHYDFAQKVFEIGVESTLGLTMWGLGNLLTVSYRTLVAKFADSLIHDVPQDMREVADRWSQYFWNAYSADFADVIEDVHNLLQVDHRTLEDERKLFGLLQNLSGGFCIGGYLSNSRQPAAYQILYSPALSAPAAIEPLALGRARFWGCPNLVHRLLYGIDEPLFRSIHQSPKWTGTEEELMGLVLPGVLVQPRDLPIREAIDWVHASIYTTIKTMKFSHMAPVCGGPVEIAVVTADRKFRWVRHKGLDAAIGDGGLFDVYRD